MSSNNLDDLFAAARVDAPSGAVRDDVWLRIAAQTAAPAAAAGTTAVVVKTAAGTKLLAIGAAIGAATAAITVLALTDRSSTIANASPTANHVPAGVGPAGRGVRLADPTTPRARAVTSLAVPDTRAPAARQGDGDSTSGSGVDDASVLAQEARLVTEARSALLRGEAERALSLVKSTTKLPVRALEPEELNLEARALRALGRSDEALATELRLKSKFPNHSLAR